MHAGNFALDSGNQCAFIGLYLLRQDISCAYSSVQLRCTLLLNQLAGLIQIILVYRVMDITEYSHPTPDGLDVILRIAVGICIEGLNG